MICIYYQNLCVLIPKKDTDKTVRYDCNSCETIFRMSGEEYFSITWFDVVLNNRKYFVKLYPGITGNAPEFVVYYYVTKPSGKQYWDEIMRLDFIPQDWTPQNAVDKLKNALLFL